MGEIPDWRTIHAFWFPPGLDVAGPDRHREMFGWWFGGGADAALPRFAPLVAAARSGLLEPWCATPPGRLSLILVLDQFPRGLFAGTPEAYSSDPDALRLAEEGLRNGDYDALDRPWEKTFFFMPLSHAEGADHVGRLERVAALAEDLVHAVPEALKPLYRFSAGQARGHLDVISRFGRYPHRDAILGRATEPAERAYLEQGDFVHRRRPPEP